MNAQIAGLLLLSPSRRLLGGIAIAAALLSAPLAAEQQILPLSPRNGAHFGTSLGRWEEWAIVGAPQDHWSHSGTARILHRTGTLWEETATLRGDDSADGDLFGGAVAIADFFGIRAIVGAPYHDGYAGAAYVFVLDGDTWVQEAELTASDAGAGELFGAAVALIDDTALVGAPSHDGSGLVYVFERSGGIWEEVGTISPADLESGDGFGAAIAFVGLGTVAVVGARTHCHGGFPAPCSGSAYVFFRSGASWIQQAELLPSDPWEHMYFGGAVAAAGLGHRAVVGAGGTLSVNQAGSAYVYERQANGSWPQVARLDSGLGEDRLGFGQAIAMSADGDFVAVGDLYDSDQHGALFGFEREAGVWRRSGVWRPRLASDGAWVGSSVALYDSQMLTGGSRDDGALPGAGAVYVEGELVFADGFESGDLTAWSAAAP